MPKVHLLDTNQKIYGVPAFSLCGRRIRFPFITRDPKRTTCAQCLKTRKDRPHA